MRYPKEECLSLVLGQLVNSRASRLDHDIFDLPLGSRARRTHAGCPRAKRTGSHLCSGEGRLGVVIR